MECPHLTSITKINNPFIKEGLVITNFECSGQFCFVFVCFIFNFLILYYYFLIYHSLPLKTKYLDVYSLWNSKLWPVSVFFFCHKNLIIRFSPVNSYVNGHAIQHYQLKQHHSISIDCKELSIFWYVNLYYSNV